MNNILNIPSEEQIMSAQAALSALANPHRMYLLNCMAEDAFTVGELAEKAEISQPLCSAHLIRLKEAGLVRRIKTGRKRIYQIQPLCNSLIKCLNGLHFNLNTENDGNN